MNEQIPNSVRRALREARRFRRIFVSLTVASPVFVGILRIFDDQFGVVGVVLTIVILLIGLLAGIVLVFASSDNVDVTNDLLDALDRAKVVARKNNRLSAAVERASYRHVFLQHLTDIAASKPAVLDNEQLAGLHDYALAYLVDQRKQLFEFTPAEKWGFCLYTYSEERKLLECLVWKRQWETPADHIPRSWRPGAGHVGVAFARNGELVYPDAAAADVAQLVSAREAENKYDKYYRSVASIPVRNANQQAIGVVVVTSDRVGRFSADELAELEPLRDWAIFHANLMASIAD